MRRRAIVILLVAVGFAGYVFYGLMTEEPVKVGASRLVRIGGQVLVEGEVRNTGDASGPVEVEVRYFDSKGHMLAEDAVSVGTLQKNVSTRFKSPPRELDGVADFSIYLNHGKNPYGN